MYGDQAKAAAVATGDSAVAMAIAAQAPDHETPGNGLLGSVVAAPFAAGRVASYSNGSSVAAAPAASFDNLPPQQASMQPVSNYSYSANIEMNQISNNSVNNNNNTVNIVSNVNNNHNNHNNDNNVVNISAINNANDTVGHFNNYASSSNSEVERNLMQYVNVSNEVHQGPGNTLMGGEGHFEGPGMGNGEGEGPGGSRY